MEMNNIKNLQDLITPILDKDQAYVGAKIMKLTSAGDNYASLILAVDITIKNGQDQEECIHAVVKMLPTNEFVQKLFNSSITFRNEVGFYQTIAPCFRQFQKEQGLSSLIESFPDFYGARINLDLRSTTIDENAVLLIKNIKDEGFTIIDRTIGFDLEQSKLILEKMAEWHGTSLALKLLKPDVFEKKLGQFLEEYQIFAGDEDAGNRMVNALLDTIKDDEFCVRHWERIKEALVPHNIRTRNKKDLFTGCFLSVVHSDMWTNNIMVKIVDNKTTAVKFVDYQLYEYSSLTRDVIFFLFTSVQISVVQLHCDDLLHFYYDKLISYLMKLKCDVSVFSFDAFMNDIGMVLKKAEFFHIMLMLAPIYATKAESKELDEMHNSNDFIQQRNDVSETCKQKAYFIVHEFFRRGWI